MDAEDEAFNKATTSFFKRRNTTIMRSLSKFGRTKSKSLVCMTNEMLDSSEISNAEKFFLSLLSALLTIGDV